VKADATEEVAAEIVGVTGFAERGVDRVVEG
jgi:hypothetical protein